MVSPFAEFRPPPESSEDSYYRDMTIALCASAVILTAVFVVAAVIIRCVMRRLRGRYVHESQHYHPSTASSPEQQQQRRRKIAVSIPVHIYEAGLSSSGGGDDTTSYELQTCAICLGEYENGECVSVLPRCKHMFHNDCIKQWVPVKSVNCPICRVPAVDRDVGIV